MKNLPPILFFALSILAGLAIAPAAQAADSVNIHATLILGSNQGGGVDGQLKRYERHLKRVFRFDTFQQKGGGASNVAIPGSGTVNVGGGHQISVNVTDAGNDKLRIAAKWTKSGRALINTTIVSSRNQPTVLGGPASGEGKLILLLVAN